ncbi:MAG: hypothetical protein IT360_27350 [Gemmatimonadaceae bacterium]|nr:hypothetical protein [Gemmatimonadaceae bacterium]
MLDPRVRHAIADFQGGHCDVEQAAQRLLEVRRETGCLSLRAVANMSESQRRLIERFTELAQHEFGD